MPSKRNSKLETKDDDELVIVSDEKIEDDEEYVSLTLMKDVILTVIGAVTGRKYVWSGAGSTIGDVDSRDAEIILERKRNTSCCGSLDSPYFEVR